MPGPNCAIPCCFTSKFAKNQDIGMFKHASRDGEFYKQWKNDLCISAIQIS